MSKIWLQTVGNDLIRLDRLAALYRDDKHIFAAVNIAQSKAEGCAVITVAACKSIDQAQRSMAILWKWASEVNCEIVNAELALDQALSDIESDKKFWTNVQALKTARAVAAPPVRRLIKRRRP